MTHSENPQMNHRLLILFAVAAFLLILLIIGCNKSATPPVAPAVRVSIVTIDDRATANRFDEMAQTLEIVAAAVLAFDRRS